MPSLSPSRLIRPTPEAIPTPDRRTLLGGAFSLAGSGLLGGCATAAPPAPLRPDFRAPPPLAPIRARPDRITGITVCLRPFRAAGPRLEAETVGDKLVVHNYGHGGSGWSLSWGYAMEAVRMALAGGARDIAVLGAGALGLTAATVAQRAGARVTIYARERPQETRSARATGVWSPDSRIALSGSVDAGFAARWEAFTRTSFRMHQQFLGLADAPVEWTERYILSDMRPSGPSPDPMGFAHYGGRIRDLTPETVTLSPADHPFPTAYARRAALPMFNITAYAKMLVDDFLLGGGRFETVEFHSPSELARLPQAVIVNCPGYGARALWKDESLVPVRGQIAWLVPQPEVTYGVHYRGVGTISRRDGLVVQNSGADESYGHNDANEAPDRAEADAAVATIARLFPTAT
ncbi:MAG: D-amino-acid oxidase [Phenylobacterium sp. SCN 70-31]|nr:MAG: D-amino-acid oxidase [Phenylobacterium sp. SCN 70-31]